MRRRGQWQGLLGGMRVRILAAVLVLLAGSSAVSILLAREALQDRLEVEITIDLRQETEEFRLLAGGLDPRRGQPFGNDLEAIFDYYFAREVPDEGETLLAYVGGRLHRMEQDGSALAAEQLAEPIGHWLSLAQPEVGSRDTDAGPIRYSALPLSGRAQDGLYVVVNFPSSELDEIDDAVRTQAVILLVTVVLASLLGLGLAGRVLRPLRSLADTAQTISETDLTQRITVPGRDEASRIAGAFNDMLERLDQAFAAQRRFLDDAGHELRAPLTVIRGHVELLDLLTDADDRRQSIELVTGEIERMDRIVGDLLLLARAERPDFLALDRVDLAELTRDVFRKATVLCAREWRLESVADVIVRADGQRLTQAMMQLAENACQHTASDVPVRIGSVVQDGQVRLWVRDSGQGVPPQDARFVFRRFVKGNAGRGGSGLGLSIVAAIAEAHGGQARLADTGGDGARFEILLPRSRVVRPEPAAAPAAPPSAAPSSDAPAGTG